MADRRKADTGDAIKGISEACSAHKGVVSREGTKNPPMWGKNQLLRTSSQ